MSEKSNKIWIEKIFDKIPLPYPIVSLFIASVVYFIFKLFSTKVVFFPWEFFHILEVSALSILIAFQLGGIRYILINMKKTFKELSINDLYERFEHRFYNSYWYYVLVASVLVPFIIIDISRILMGYAFYFYIKELTMWSFLLDTFNLVTSYLILFLMAIILWIVLNITWVLNEVSCDPYRRLIKIDIFSIDKIGGLKPFRNFILKVHTFYFICITLAIIYHISPFIIFSYANIFLVILFLVGICFFLIGLWTIQKILRGRIEEENTKVNELYQEQHQRLMKIVSEGKSKDTENELDWVSTSLQTLHIERERIVLLYSSARGYDLMTIIEFLSSIVLPPLIASSQKLIQEHLIKIF